MERKSGDKRQNFRDINQYGCCLPDCCASESDLILEGVDCNSSSFPLTFSLLVCNSFDKTMFFKYVTLFLAFTASAIAGAIQSGTYRITNVATQSTVRANETDSKIYVSSTKEDSQFELVSSGLMSLPWNILLIICFKLQWDVKETNDGGYTLKNLAWADYAAPSFSVGPIASRLSSHTVHLKPELVVRVRY